MVGVLVGIVGYLFILLCRTIVEEDLRLGVGDFGIWIRLDDERNNDNHLIIR